MKLLLQRSLDPDLASCWIEEAYWTEERLHGFLIQEREGGSFFEPRYGPERKIYCLSDRLGETRVFAAGSTRPLTSRATLHYAWTDGGRLLSLQCSDPESPYGLCLEDGAIRALDSSATWLTGFARESWVSSLERLYRGPEQALVDIGPTPARRFSVGPDGLYYCHGHRLLHRARPDGAETCLFQTEEGELARPCWTPAGVFVTQEDCPEHALWLIDGPPRKVWHGPEERVYVTDYEH